MRGKVIYRIACGTCSVCITYGLIIVARDMPAGTIITQPYFSDIPVRVILK